MSDSYLLFIAGTVVVCLLIAVANLLLASRAISSGAALALAVGFTFIGLTWLMVPFLMPKTAPQPGIAMLLPNTTGALGMTALWCGFWLRGGFRVSAWFAGGLLALWLLPALAVPILQLPPGLYVPFAATSIAVGALSSIWALARKRSSAKNPGDWALIIWLCMVLPVSVWAVLMGLNTARTAPNAVWIYYLGFLPTVFAGIGLFTMLSFTLDAVRDSTELALTDGLTGLLNRRAFDRELVIACARAERFQRELSLVLLDIDNFKQLNDSFGHPAGDAVLRTVARVIEAQSRRIDITARIGGEEFALLLPDTPAAAALRLADRLRQAIVQSGNERVAYTASFGVACVEDAGATPKALFKAADEALYAAKEAGRNCVRHAAHPKLDLSELIGVVK